MVRFRNINKIHCLTGAEIAASKTLIGNAAKGGNWNLEYQTGAIASKLAFTAETQRSYVGTFEEEEDPLAPDLVEDLNQDLVEDLATVTTDKQDYPPGSTATITGENFEPGETVELQVLHILLAKMSRQIQIQIVMLANYLSMSV